MLSFLRSALLIALLLPQVCMADREVSFVVDLADQIPVLRFIKRGVVFKYWMSDFRIAEGVPVSRVGDGTLQFADVEITVPNCIARHIASSTRDDVKVDLFNTLDGRALPTSGVELTFAPGADAPRPAELIRLRFLTEPVRLATVEVASEGPIEARFQRVALNRFCEWQEQSLMYEKPRALN